MSAATSEELIAVYESERRRKEDWCVIQLDTGELANGTAKPGELVPGVTYRFFGKWIDSQWGKQFRWTSYVQSTPHSRHGVVLYLAKYASGVGQVMANRLVDLYGESGAIGILKTDPVRVSQEAGLPLSKAKEAAELLIAIEGVQATKIELMELFDKTGLYANGIAQAMKLWGAKAPTKIKNDPFSLLWHRFPGAGFSRVDKLYQSLGHPSDRCKRQVYCAVDTVDKDDSGSIWVPFSVIERRINDLVTGNVNPEKACKIAVKVGLLHREDREGRAWFALRRLGDAERYTAQRIQLLLGDVSEWATQESIDSAVTSTETALMESRNINTQPLEVLFEEILDF